MKILEDNSKRLLAMAYIALLVGATTLSFEFVPRATHAATSPLGIVIPLYTYPTDGTWAAVIQAKQSYPNVPFIAVINPNSGPGASQDPAFLQGIEDLQAAGIKVLGYVATGYAVSSYSSLGTVEAQVSDYKSWYNVNGIMFDEMSNTPGYESYYSTLNGYVHSVMPGSLTVGNPGTSVPPSYIGTLDVLNVYEDSGYPSLSSITYAGYSPTNFSAIVIGASLDASFLTTLSGVVSWAYVTDAGLPNPYDVLPSYFTAEVAALSALDLTTTSSTATPTASSTTSSATSSSGSATVTVSSVDLSGNAVTGMWTTWNQNGATLATGYTPATFAGTTGGAYSLTVADYQSTVFCRWQDGTTNPVLSFTLAGNLALTAYYSTNGSCPTSTAYAVTFAESGLATGTQWSVTFNGVTSAVTSSTLTFSGMTAGTYAWSAGAATCGTGCRFSSSPSSGTLSVSAPATQSISFTRQYQVAMATTPGGGGTTSPSSGSTSWVVAGASAPISAGASSGYTFASWKSSSPSIAISSPTAASTSATVIGPGTITANFNAKSASVAVKSVTLSGSSFGGMWTTWNQGGAQLASGYTQISFTGAVGETYIVGVSDYGSTVFCHWQDGSTNPQRSVTLRGNLALTAYYSTTGSCPATTVRVTVDSKSVTGVQFTGMWFTVTANGKTITTGYTTLTFTATVGVAYTISMSDWNNYVFAYWGGGSTNPVLTMAPTQSTTLTAYYNTGGLF